MSMAGDGGIGGRCSADLPDDILGAIYRRCSSLRDRARFAAVCTSWRAYASCQPKLPAVPLLYPSTGNGFLDQRARAYSSPEDGGVLRAGFPCFPYGKRVVGSHDGGWVAVAADCQIEIEIMNLFTGASVPGPGHIACRCPPSRHKISIKKVIFSEDPTSEGCLLAMITTTCTIALYRSPGGGWTAPACVMGMSFLDIAFFNGDLYGLSCSDLLYKLLVGVNEFTDEVLILPQKLTIQRPEMFSAWYIFQLGDKLAVVASSTEAQTSRVFELASNDTTTQACKYTWAEVTSLGDHALFLGPRCCRAVCVSSAEHSSLHDNFESLPKLDLGSCVVYCYESQGVDQSQGIRSRGYLYHERGDYSRNSCTWILPPYL